MSSLEDMADFYYATLSTSRPRVLTDHVSVEHTIPRPQVPCVYFVSPVTVRELRDVVSTKIK